METQDDSQQPTDFQQDSPLKLKSFFFKNKSLIIIIAILSILSFSTTGYLLLSDKKPSETGSLTRRKVALLSSPTPKPQEIISNTPSASMPTPSIIPVAPTATWSAYVSSNYSYSIKYPPNWTAQMTTQQDSKILEYVVFNPVATKAGTLSITLSYGTRTYAEALALDPQAGTSITVASASATKKDSKDSNGYGAINVIVPFGSNTIIFNAKTAYSDLFNQMLTTLKLAK